MRRISGLAMLSFPNRSRSYDLTRNCVRFWAYDQSMEVSFFVEAEALCRMDPSALNSEVGLLDSFDSNRARIYKAAAKIYERGRRGSYVLAPADV